MDIVKEIGMPAMLGQLAEECCELGKAALKLQRILDGKNPTPVTKEKAREGLLEEATDVQTCLLLLQLSDVKTMDFQQQCVKIDRWFDRIRAAKEAREEATNEP